MLEPGTGAGSGAIGERAVVPQDAPDSRIRNGG